MRICGAENDAVLANTRKSPQRHKVRSYGICFARTETDPCSDELTTLQYSNMRERTAAAQQHASPILQYGRRSRDDKKRREIHKMG